MENSNNPETAETPRIILPPRRCTKRLLNVSDTLLSLFVITPMVVTHWKGTWALMDQYHQQFPPLNCFLFGCMLHTSFVLIKDLLQKEFSTSTTSENRSTKKVIAQFLAMRIYTYVFSLGCNMHWRGGWAVLEGLFAHEFWTAIIPSAVCLVALTGLKSLRNLSAPPTFVITDSKNFAFSFPTRFRVKFLHIYDSKDAAHKSKATSRVAEVVHSKDWEQNYPKPATYYETSHDHPLIPSPYKIFNVALVRHSTLYNKRELS